MIIVHLDPGKHKPVRQDEDVHIWLGEDDIRSVEAYNRASNGRPAALVVQRHVFVFEELEARQRDRLRDYGQLVQLDEEAYGAFFNLLAVVWHWEYFFDYLDTWSLLARATEHGYAWHLFQRLAAALQQWTRTWPPGEPTRAAFAALRRLRGRLLLPKAWMKNMRPHTLTDSTLPSRWAEALNAKA